MLELILFFLGVLIGGAAGVGITMHVLWNYEPKKEAGGLRRSTFRELDPKTDWDREFEQAERALPPIDMSTPEGQAYAAELVKNERPRDRIREIKTKGRHS